MVSAALSEGGARIFQAGVLCFSIAYNQQGEPYTDANTPNSLARYRSIIDIAHADKRRGAGKQ